MSYLISILAALVANWLRLQYGLKFVFTIATSLAVVGVVLLFLLWEENSGHGEDYGTDRDENSLLKMVSRLIKVFADSIVLIFTNFQVSDRYSKGESSCHFSKLFSAVRYFQ